MSLRDNLISYWKLDEASGTRVDSVVASGNDLTSNATVGQTTGKIGSAAQFNKASSRYLSRTSNASLQCGDIDFTLAGWFYLDSDSTVLFGKDTNTPANSRDYTADVINISPGVSKLRFYLGGGASSIVTDGTSLSLSTWYFFAVWHDSTLNTVNTQVNAGTAVSAAEGTIFDVSSAEFRIGARAYAAFEGYFDGRIDEVGFWKRVLTAAERTTLYNGGAGMTYPFERGLPFQPPRARRALMRSA